MEFKTPTKKGFKTPRYRPPLPILHESPSGLCLDEYDWPMFNGYYNGTSVIIDEPRGSFTLSNKGFFGKGSLSKGCPNLVKRKVSNNVIYESQWKRRKQWIESLDKLLKNKDISVKTGNPGISSCEVKPADINYEKNEAINTNGALNESIHTCQNFNSQLKENENLLDNVDHIKNNESFPKDQSGSIETPRIELSKNNVPTCYNNTSKKLMTINFSNDKNTIKDLSVYPESKDLTLVNSSEGCKKKSNCITTKGILNPNEVLVISDIGSDLEHYFMNLNPHIEEERVKTAIEVLYLSLEEAFFLTYACNCLQIVDLSSNILGMKDMWTLFQASQADFIEKYAAYHYFRAKGWVVKSGTKFGGDFLLYKKGPLHFHASYIVIVEVLVNGKNVKNKLTWQKIIGMNRMAESATKEILICHVFWPDVETDKFNDPTVLKEFNVTETLLRRWQPTHEKTASLEKLLQ